MLSDELFDWTSLTPADGGLDLLGHLIRWSLAPGKGLRKRKFKARVLSPRFPLSAYQAKAVNGSSDAMPNSQPKQWLKARIIGENSPHEFLPDPCDPALTDAEAYVWRLIAMHTTFISESSIDCIEPITRGDIISVELEKSGNSYNLQYGTFSKLLSVENPAENIQPSCMSLVTLFGEISQDPIAVKLPAAQLRRSAPLGLMGGTTYSQEDCNKPPGGGRLPTLTKADLQSLLASGAFTKLLNLIAFGEAGGKDPYSAVNKGDPATPAQYAGILKAAGLPVDLKTATIRDVIGAGSACKGKSGKQCVASHGHQGVIYATGRYQIIPSTLEDLLGPSARRLGIETLFSGTEPFNQNTQDTLAVVDLLAKQPILGSYLMGVHDQICAAQIQLAAEWASFPLPIDHRGQGGACKKNTSYWCGGKDKAANHTLAEIEATLKDARQKIQASAAYAALKSSGKIPTTVPV